MVVAACELVDRLEFLTVGAPHLFVDPRCAVSFVFCHSLDGQTFGPMRVGEQPLQSSRFAVAVFSDCLCNTHLQSSDLLPDFVPGEGVPVAALGRGRTNRSVKINRHLHFLREEDSADSLAKRDPIDVGISGPLQTGLGLFDPLHAVSPGPALRLACLGTTKAGELQTAFPCSRSVTGRVRSTLCTGGAPFASGHVREPEPDRLPFGPSLDQPRMACSL